MAPIPFVLMIWGPKIRAKSRFASAILEKEVKVIESGMVDEKPFQHEEKGKDLEIGV